MTDARRLIRVFAGLLTVISFGCANGERQASNAFVVMRRYPHDPSAYTQGLIWDRGVLYESTGQYGRSDVRRVDLATGRVLASHPLSSDRFGEGLALLKGVLYQLTWESHIGYTYDPATLALRDSFPYPGEGWGLTTDGTSLIMSDGSDSLRVLSPSTFQVERVIHVRYQGKPLYKLNELEYVNGDVLANVYESNWVLRIDLKTGDVRELLNFADLYPDRPGSAEVMNGVATAPDTGALLLTGKFWPVLFEVRLQTPRP